jgi:hypothetical protein
MSDSRAAEVIDQQQRLRSERANWDSLYQQVADRCWPQMADFNVRRTPGENRSEKIFDSTAPLALDRGAAAFYSLMVPDHQLWHGLGIRDQELMEYPPFKAWMESIRDVLFSLRRSPMSGFSGQSQESIKTLLGFGTQCMQTEEAYGEGRRGTTAIKYRAIHLSELDFSENSSGLVDCVYRLFEFTARQAVEQFGLDAMPDKIKDKYEKRDEASKFEFIHHVSPNRKRDQRRIDYAGKKFYSCYVSIEGKVMLEEGGYRRFPFHVSRYSTNPREGRGRGPAIVLLPDIKMLNEMEKTTLRAAHLSVDPPLLIYADGALQGFQMRPRALNYGGVDEQGRQLVQPLQTGANLPLAIEMSDARRKLINEGFWLTLFQILVENPKMTATEAMLRAQEKGQLLAAPLGRQKLEWFGPMIRRELDIAAEADLLPPPPEDVVEELANRGLLDVGPNGNITFEIADEIEIEYTSPLDDLLMASEAIKANRFVEQLMPVAQVDPSVLDIIDTDEWPRQLAKWNGVSGKLLRTKQQVLRIREERSQRAEQAQLLEAAPVAADAAKNLASAAATAQSLPQPLPEAA